jgi:hypothetical protein
MRNPCLTGKSGPVNLARKMAPKNTKTPPKEKKTEKVQRRKGKVVTDVRPDTVPNCPPDRNLFLEALAIQSTKSTSLTSSRTPSPQPQRSQPARAAHSEPRASQPRESTKSTLFPYGHQRTKSKSTKGSARKATRGKTEEAPSPEPQRSTQSALGTSSLLETTALRHPCDANIAWSLLLSFLTCGKRYHNQNPKPIMVAVP